MSNDTTSPLADRKFRTSAAVKLLLEATSVASGDKLLISRPFLEELLNEINGLMVHWHPNPQGSDWRCEFCGNTERSEWHAEYGRYEQLPVEHHKKCFGKTAVNVLSHILYPAPSED